MSNKQYLLDSNIVIRIWREYPTLFNNMEKSNSVDFKISHDVAKELSQKEFKDFNGIPVLSDKFLGLLSHVLKEELCCTEDLININIKINEKTNVYTINDNKLSPCDFNLICLSKKHEEFSLVTEDRRVINSAKLIIDPSRVLNFEEFIEDIEGTIKL